MKINTYLKTYFTVLLVVLQTHGLVAQSLKSLAAAKGKYIGNLMRDGFFNDHQVYNGATDLIAKTEYNALVLGNKMKMSQLLKNRPADPFNVQISDINTANIDRFVAYADANGMRKRGHVMIWYHQIPNWLQQEAPTWTAQQVYDFSRSYIIALSTYTRGKIDEWDVLNEAVLWNGFRTNTWYDIVNTQANSSGQVGYLEYFASLFKWARQGDPNVPLFYNDYSIEAYGTNKNNVMRTMVKDLKNLHNAPIDGVGLQSHFGIDQVTPTFVDKVGQTMDDLGAAGFTVNITELDIKICTGDAGTWADQRIAYENIVATALSKSNCNTVLIWGMSDNDSWIPLKNSACGDATPHDSIFQKKPAYYGIRDALSGLGITNGISAVSGPTSVMPGTSPIVSVNYSASQTRDVVVMFQRDNSPYTTYESVRTTVSVGTGTIDVALPIDLSVPIAAADYHYQVYITPVGGNWGSKLGNLSQKNVSVVAITDQLNSVNGPIDVQAGSSPVVSVSYAASQSRDVVVMFQRDNNPYTTYKTVTTTVLAGIGSINVNVPLPGSVPVATADYQYQAYVTPVGGNWGARLDNMNQNNVSVTSGAARVANQDAFNDEKPYEISHYPNPVINEVFFEFSLESSNAIELSIFDLEGRLVHSVAKTMELGNNKLSVDLSGQNPGLFVYRINSADFVKSGKLILSE
ncbi:endo-1,4-beta-xylanase [Reichenbachiella sp.]|uniref:endo-1,4-beta-xylanase n=1 Tax=Reichenbachiella sp. TaxID=2184521 RepID=UPI003296F706